jgi:hypothetical protein
VSDDRARVPSTARRRTQNLGCVTDRKLACNISAWGPGSACAMFIFLGAPQLAYAGLLRMLYSHRRVSPISRFAANRDPDSRSRQNQESVVPFFPIPAESARGIGDSLPDSRPNRESRERELGISGSAQESGTKTETRLGPLELPENPETSCCLRCSGRWECGPANSADGSPRPSGLSSSRAD